MIPSMARRRSKSLSALIAQLAGLLILGLATTPWVSRAYVGVLVVLLCVLTALLTVAMILKSNRSELSPMTVRRGGVTALDTPTATPVSNPFGQSAVPPMPTSMTPLERVRALDWFQFERLIAALFAECGFRVERSGGANPDGGIDLLVQLDGKSYGVQCKHWKAWKVGVKEVRQFVGALKDRRLAHGIFVTLQSYTPDAKALADRNQVELAGPDEISRMLASARCEQNPRLLAILDDTRKLCPKCESEMVLRTVKNGRNVGSQFWGCSTYPRCHYKTDIAPAKTDPFAISRCSTLNRQPGRGDSRYLPKETSHAPGEWRFH
jgi:restriction system protein